MNHCFFTFDFDVCVASEVDPRGKEALSLRSVKDASAAITSGADLRVMSRVAPCRIFLISGCSDVVTDLIRPGRGASPDCQMRLISRSYVGRLDVGLVKGM